MIAAAMATLEAAREAMAHCTGSAVLLGPASGWALTCAVMLCKCAVMACHRDQRCNGRDRGEGSGAVRGARAAIAVVRSVVEGAGGGGALAPRSSGTKTQASREVVARAVASAISRGEWQRATSRPARRGSHAGRWLPRRLSAGCLLPAAQSGADCAQHPFAPSPSPPPLNSQAPSKPMESAWNVLHQGADGRLLDARTRSQMMARFGPSPSVLFDQPCRWRSNRCWPRGAWYQRDAFRQQGREREGRRESKSVRMGIPLLRVGLLAAWSHHAKVWGCLGHGLWLSVTWGWALRIMGMGCP